MMLVGVTSAYFLLAGQMDETTQYLSMGAILFLLTLFLFTPSSKKTKRKKPTAKKKVKSSEETFSDDDDEHDNEIPTPVRKGVEDGISLRDRKLAKLAEKEEKVDTSNQTIIQNVTYNINDSVVTGDMSAITNQDDDEVEVISDEPEYHTAEEYVVEVDADSIEEANIERFVSDRAERHQNIRKRIE